MEVVLGAVPVGVPDVEPSAAGEAHALFRDDAEVCVVVRGGVGAIATVRRLPNVRVPEEGDRRQQVDHAQAVLQWNVARVGGVNIFAVEAEVVLDGLRLKQEERGHNFQLIRSCTI